MLFSAFDTNFSNQGVRMKIKEIEIKNSKTHALVYINPWGRAVIEAYIL